MRVQLEKRGVLGAGQVKKGGSLPRHIPILNIYVSTPPPGVIHGSGLLFFVLTLVVFRGNDLSYGSLYKSMNLIYASLWLFNPDISEKSMRSSSVLNLEILSYENTCICLY